MSANRHIIPILPHRSAPPSEEEIFGVSRNSEIEVGMLQMQILWILDKKETHGYELMDRLSRIKSAKVTQGTLYPTLKKLRKHGFVAREKQGERYVYHITPAGKKVLDETSTDFTRTFFGIFQDYVCHKCLDHDESKHEAHPAHRSRKQGAFAVSD